MDRLQTETSSDLATNSARHKTMYVWGDDPLFTVAVNVCDNCGQSCDVVTRVPEFNFLGCDTCYDEAMAIIATEEGEKLRKIGPQAAHMFPKAEVA